MEEKDYEEIVAEGVGETGAFGAESTDGDFLNGFFAEESAEKAGSEAEDPVLFDETPDGAESEPSDESGAGSIGFVEHGQKYFVEKDVLTRFAKAVGKKPEEVIDLYQKGCGFEGLRSRLETAQKDSELIESYIRSRGISAEKAREELSEVCRRLPLRQKAAELQSRTPGLSDEDALRFAELEADRTGRENREQDRFFEGKVQEIGAFQKAHPELSALPNDVIAAFDAGVPLEEAYRSWTLGQQVETLRQELFEAKIGKAKAEQLGYARTHSAGSAENASGTVPKDPFLEGLFG